MPRHSLTAMFFTLTLTACSASTTTVGGAALATISGPTELAYCPGSVAYAGGVALTGKATYVKRMIDEGGLGSANINDPVHPASVRAIRFAEVRLTNSTGTLVQCSETDASGNFTLSAPPGTYSLQVMARALNSHLAASILDQAASNQIYSLAKSVVLNGPTNVALQASASGATLGGAFNILDRLADANAYLLAQVGHCSSRFQGCVDFVPTAHKVSVYWRVGFNPNTYLGAPDSALSFYLPGYSRLFILGGMNGDTDHADTDHYDDSVIVHEYGHFLEDNWLKSDSPGGAHDGDELLDPRLAWSEGWGDFIQAAVLGRAHYTDTIGNADGTAAIAFDTDTESATLGADLPQSAGEGNFREFAVTRTLWDAIDNTPGEFVNGVSDNVSGAFPEIWAALTRARYGFRDLNFAFRNVGLFHLAQGFLNAHPLGSDAAAANWANVATMNFSERSTARYAQYVQPVSDGACASGPAFTATGTPYYFQIAPKSVAGDNGSLGTSDIFQNNRFFHLHIDSSTYQSHTLALNYQDDDGHSVTADLDLYLYGGKARFATVGDVLAMSRTSPTGQVVQSETLGATLSPGDYLINVNVYTGNGVGGVADYNLFLDGVALCPANLVPR